MALLLRLVDAVVGWERFRDFAFPRVIGHGEAPGFGPTTAKNLSIQDRVPRAGDLCLSFDRDDEDEDEGWQKTCFEVCAFRLTPDWMSGGLLSFNERVKYHSDGKRC